MKTKWQRLLSILAIATFGAMALVFVAGNFRPQNVVLAQANPTPTPAAAPTAPEFDQKAALAKLREQIKGREKEPASAVFKNIQTMKDRPAGQLLAVMELGYARSLGVNCTHCHVPDKWESEEKTQKQTARDMSAMVSKINGDLLKSIKTLKSDPPPVVNCTTCHRGQVTPASNLPPPKS